MTGNTKNSGQAGAQTLVGWGAGLFAAHIVSGYMQEMLFAIKGYTFGFYLTLARYVINALLAFAYLRLFDNGANLRYLHFHFRWIFSLLGGTNRRWWWWEERKEKDDDDANTTGDDGPPSKEVGETTADVSVGLAEGEDGKVLPFNNRFLTQSKGSIILEMGAEAADAAATHSLGTVGQKVPLQYYLLLSFLSVMALGLGTSALAFLNYPTKVILKTSKLVVIMLFSRIILGKKHSGAEYAMAMSMVAGLVLFTLGDYYVKIDASSAVVEASLESSNLAAGDAAAGAGAEAQSDPMEESFEWRTAKGVFLLFLSLIFEAINVNMQKKILVGYERSSPAELVFYNAFFGSLVTFVIVLVNGELFAAWEFAVTHPDCHFYVIGFALFSSCGVACAIMVLHNFDPMTIGIVVTGRKSITVLTSFILIPKPDARLRFALHERLVEELGGGQQAERLCHGLKRKMVRATKAMHTRESASPTSISAERRVPQRVEGSGRR
ncbi:UAA transporter family protein [Acanthamoeba castellanii str. Neff]|uniref:UAA transporter family protein n=1 Tax=Acanthamoeba castellanii (strain ATCC 30010 / Neff) TaxID=1257118 RepID=L8HGK7_ACACF|nr:UAA transporter family protein [Acanthamoeba castellanii str. Neff]ELR23853.1 UAA transporter family protein [Acanthamoeba castellanii str. Neff]